MLRSAIPDKVPNPSANRTSRIKPRRPLTSTSEPSACTSDTDSRTSTGHHLTQASRPSWRRLGDRGLRDLVVSARPTVRASPGRFRTGRLPARWVPALEVRRQTRPAFGWAIAGAVATSGARGQVRPACPPVLSFVPSRPGVGRTVHGRLATPDYERRC